MKCSSEGSTDVFTVPCELMEGIFTAVVSTGSSAVELFTEIDSWIARMSRVLSFPKSEGPDCYEEMS